MSSFGTGSTNTTGSSIVLTAFTGTDGNNAGTDGLVPGPSTQQFGYILGAGGDWTLDIKGNIPLNESSERIATTEFVQDVVGNAVLGGNAQLSQLTDVTIAGLADDQFLQYNNNSGKWENATLTLSLISDVNLNGLVDGNSLVYDANAGEWIPGVGGGGGANSLNGLTDVTLDGNETTDHFLVHNGAGQFVNRLIDSSDLSNSINLTLLDANQTFTGDVRADTQGANDNSTLLSTTAFVQQEITSLNLGTASQNNTNDFLASNSSIDILNDVTLDGNETTKHLLVHNGAGQFVNRLIDSSDLSNSANIVLLDANQTFTGDVRTDTQGANDNSTLLATTAFVQQEITNASIADLSDVNTLANIQDGNVLAWVANNNRFEFTAPAQTYTDENTQDAVNDMLNNNGAVHTNISFTYDDNADNMTVAVSLASTDLTDSNDLARLNSPSLTGVPLAPTANQGTNTTQLATTAYVQTEITTLNLGTASQNATGDFLASNSSIDILNDVNLGGALVNGKVLKVVGGVLTQADDAGKTEEEIQDVVGPMLDHANHSTGISFAYDDNNNRIDSTLTQNLQDLSSLNVGDGNFIVGDGNNFVVESGAVARTSLGLTIGTDIQAQDAVLQDISNLNPISANKFLYTTAQNDFTTADITTVGLALLDDATVQDQRNTLELGTASTSDTGDFLASNSSVNDLNDVTIGAVALNHILKYTANNVFENVALSTSDLSDNSNIDKLDGNQTLTGNKVFEGDVEFDVDGNGTYTVKTPILQSDDKQIANTEWVRDVVAQVGNVGALDDLNDVALDGNETTDHFLVHNGAGQFINKTISSSDLSNSANIVLLDTNQTFTGDVRADTQANGDNSTLLSTTAYVQTEITTLNLGTASQNNTGDFLASNSSLDGLTNVTLDGNETTKHLLVHNGAGQFVNRLVEVADLSDNNTIVLTSGNQTITDQKDFTGGTLLASTQLASDSSTKVANTAFVQQEISATDLNELNDITIANPSNRQSLIYNNGSWINATLSSSDLSDVNNIALLDANQDFTGNIEFKSNTTALTQNASDNSTKVATTKYVDVQIDTDIATTSIGGLSNVTLGGVALSEGQVLRVSNDNSTFVNAQLSYNDLSDNPTLGTSASKDAGTGADNVLLLTQATTLPALDGSILTALGSVGLLSNVDITTNAPQNNQVLLWDGNNFIPGDRTGYEDEDARDAIGTALNGGTHTGATTITFTNNDNADTIDLTLEIESSNLTDVSTDAPSNTQVLRFTTEAGDNQNKYVPTTLGTASNVNTGVDSGNVPVISDHYFVNGTNEKGDLLVYGRYVEVIDYGSVADAFNANTHFAIDFGAITDSVIYASEDYGVLVC